jgi:hypothetical protein
LYYFIYLRFFSALAIVAKLPWWPNWLWKVEDDDPSTAYYEEDNGSNGRIQNGKEAEEVIDALQHQNQKYHREQVKGPPQPLPGWMNLTGSAKGPQWQATLRFMDLALGMYTWPPFYMFVFNGGYGNGLLVDHNLLSKFKQEKVIK